MLKLEKKNAIVKHIQDGLANASQNKKDRNISFNNNSWNDNLNYIFDSVMQLNGMFDLTCFKFNRSGFYMASIFDKESKTLISICSDKRIATLLSRSHIDTIHYTDAFCQLSKDIDPCQQMNLFGESEDKVTSINSLLRVLTKNFAERELVEHYLILQVKINHASCELLDVVGLYLNKQYTICKRDDTWNECIKSDYDNVLKGNQIDNLANSKFDEEESYDVVTTMKDLTIKKSKEK